MNRLGDETSPYLRQHRDNPVDWFPWGDEAFAEARETDRPLLISVGYSSCHWCHVMAHESFEDEDTARLMNEWFVNVKVDREERPDVDAVYMEATQAMTGRGGWPMTVFALPDGRPFYCGTYFPKDRRGGMPSFAELLTAVHDAWTNKRDELGEHAGQLTAHLQRTPVAPEDAALPDAATLSNATETMLSVFDPTWGGFGRAPKFPQAMSLDHLLRHHVRTGSRAALDAVVTSLDAMAAGGMYDHLGGGFSRYSVDDQWLVPHFEKMLYDNALLTRSYLHAWEVTGEPRFLQVLEETIGYVLRDLRHPEGGFHSAEDADSLTPEGHSEEGAFYTWTPDEVATVLAGAGLAEHTEDVLEWYGIAPGGNFEGRSIPNRMNDRGDLARPPHIEAARVALFEARRARHRPGLDDKVLTEWNGLMLAALADAAFATDNADWLEHAERNAEFLCRNLRREDGRWLRSWQDGRAEGRGARARHLAYANDYGAMLVGLLSLYEATGRRRWLDEARLAADDMLDLFWDPEGGGLFTTGHDAESLVARPKDLTDNAVPAANSLAAVGLFRLEALVDEARYGEHARTILRLLGPAAARSATAFGMLLWAAELEVVGRTEIVVTGDRPDLVDELRGRYLPLAIRSFGEPLDSPLWTGRGADAAYVCTGFTCLSPAQDADSLRSQLDALSHT